MTAWSEEIGGGQQRLALHAAVPRWNSATAHLLVLDRKKGNDPRYVGTLIQSNNLWTIPEPASQLV